MTKLGSVGHKILSLSVDVSAWVVFFPFCSLIAQFDAVALTSFQVSSIVDVFVFALEGAVKGNSGLNKIKSSIDFQLLATRQGHPTSIFGKYLLGRRFQI